MYFWKKWAISTLSGKPLKFHFTHLNRNILSSEIDVMNITDITKYI